MKKEQKKTIGALSQEAASKPLETRDPIELARQNEADYINNLLECIKTHKNLFSEPCFYIVVITKQEPILKNVFRNLFAGTLACPTPDFDQSVFRYNKSDDKLELLWALPNENDCIKYKMNALSVIAEERQLLHDILDFYDGTLLELAKKLNGELPTSPQVVLEIREMPENAVITEVN